MSQSAARTKGRFELLIRMALEQIQAVGWVLRSADAADCSRASFL